MTLVPDRRTIVVLSSLIGSMTLASGLLLLLEPAPSNSWGRAIELTSVRSLVSEDEQIFEVEVPVHSGRWDAIVIHDSGSRFGSAATVDRVHRQLGRDGLGYHFVINNQQGDHEDGQIERGPRWRQQQDGHHSGGTRGEWLNRRAIGICLIGDLAKEGPSNAQIEQLIWLVQRLQARLEISANRVFSPSDLEGRAGSPPIFPIDQFRAQLLARRP